MVDHSIDDKSAIRNPQSAILVRTFLAAIAFRALSAVLALLINVSFPLYQREQLTVFDTTSPFWDTFARYDAGNFYQIARYGYTQGPMAYVPGGRSTLAYFPAYPLLMRWVGALIGRRPADVYIGGVVVSWLAFAIAMPVLYRLARLDLHRRQAERAVLLTAVFPFAFFYGLAYTESTFLLTAVLAFYFFRTRRWIAGGIAGGVATATRVNGIFIVPALAWIAWRETGPAPRHRAMALAGLVLAASGFCAYCIYVYQLTGNPFEWAAVLQRWGYHPGGTPWMAPVRLVRQLITHPYRYLTTDRMAPYDTLYGVTGILFAIATPFVWRRFGAAYGIFMLLNLWLPLSSGVFEGMGRYCSVLFPCFMWLATIPSRLLFTSLLVTFALFYTLGLALFTTIHPLF